MVSDVRQSRRGSHGLLLVQSSIDIHERLTNFVSSKHTLQRWNNLLLKRIPPWHAYDLSLSHLVRRRVRIHFGGGEFEFLHAGRVLAGNMRLEKI